MRDTSENQQFCHRFLFWLLNTVDQLLSHQNMGIYTPLGLIFFGIGLSSPVLICLGEWPNEDEAKYITFSESDSALATIAGTRSRNPSRSIWKLSSTISELKCLPFHGSFSFSIGSQSWIMSDLFKINARGVFSFPKGEG